MFCEEFGTTLRDRLRRTGAPPGQRPVLHRVTRERRVLTTAVGLTWSGKIYKRPFDGGLDSQAVLTAWEHIRRQLPQGLILSGDQAPIHTREAGLRYRFDHPELIVEPLPQ